jgi:cytochrome b6-f complex iron-sulfur subunit
MDRRSFINLVGLGAIATSLPVALAACSAKETTKVAPVAAQQATEFKSVGTLADLDKKGFLLNKETAGSPVLVVRDGSDASKLIAVNPTCSHNQCIVDWKGDRKAFECPCHGAKFSAGGQLVQGPATKPLPTYVAKVEGDAVMVKLA